MAIIPPQHQPSPQSEHGIHRPITSQTVQVIALITSQHTTSSKYALNNPEY
jgi:hypothetical protein